MIGELTRNEMDQVIAQQLIGRIGCHDGKNIYIVPIGYAYDGKHFYAHSKEGEKIQFMRKYKDVCFQIEIIEDLAHWRSVLAWGKFEELRSGAAEEKAARLLSDRFRPLHTSEQLTQPPRSHHAPQIVEKKTRAIYFRIKISAMTGRFERPSDAPQE